MSGTTLHTVYTVPRSRTDLLADLKEAGARRALEIRVAEVRSIFAEVGLCLDDLFACSYDAHLGQRVEWIGSAAPPAETLATLGDHLSHLSTIHRVRTPDAGLEQLREDIDDCLELPRDVLSGIARSAEKAVRAHPVSVLDKEEPLRRFLEGASGPLPLAGPATAHGVDEMIARVHARAPWLHAATGRIWKSIRARVQTGQGGMGMPPVLLYGPGGTGKSMLAQILSEESSVPCFEMDGSAGSAAFRVAGVEAGWSTHRIGEPLRLVAQTRCANPLMVINELDKAAGGLVSQGGARTSLVEALLPFLDPQSASRFRCPATGLEADLSKVSWLFTANDLHGFSQPFLSRVVVIHVPRLTLADYLAAARVMCGTEDLELLAAVEGVVRENHARPGFSLRHVARAIELGAAVGADQRYH